MLLQSIIKFFVAPLAIAVIMYIFVHFQFLILHKFLRVELSRRLRMTICVATFALSFIGAIFLILLNEYFRLHLNTGTV